MENRDRIIEAAAELFRTYGIRSVTMDLLANQLGISKRTIYEVFSDKDDLLIGVLKWMAGKQRELVKRVLEESENAIVAIFKLLEFNRNHFQEMSPAFHADIKKYHHEILMKEADKYELPDYSNNIQVIERGIKEKLFRKDINPDLVNRCLYSMARSIMDQDLYPFDMFTWREVAKN
ncbi:MAG TPA: TetR/AcrR family transcriptional regulator, partial [Anaerovoracaceae bacterium]|nr:TetR/AcrR family transcriptional regulator [Anaerovoracaceae bacterium]